MLYHIPLLFILLILTSHTEGLVCWKGDSSTSSTYTEARYGYVCVRYNYCSTGWNGLLCSTTPVYYYDQMLPVDVNNLPKNNNKDVLACSTDYCNDLIKPRTICRYGSSLNSYMSEFTSESKNCYSYNYDCKSANQYCLQTDIGSTRIAYGISNSTSCSGVTNLVKCCSTNLCTASKSVSSSAPITVPTFIIFLIMLHIVLT